MAFRKAIGLCLMAAMGAVEAGAQSSSGDEFFEKKIRPVLAANCYGCHSSKLKSPMGGLVLDTKAGARAGGASGPLLVPGKPAESLLLRALGYNDVRLKMPPTGKLSDAVIADFERWIAEGAADPRTDAPGTTAPTARVIDYVKGRQWWAFQPAKQSPAPPVKNQAWLRTQIDSFILAKLEKANLSPSPAADPRTLVVRAYLDLIGLRPTYEEVQAFVNDPAPDRYEKLVDRLLANPHYGERWGRYWLDVARYGEESGSGQQYAFGWRYRDWVIEAFNHDLPYDRFVKLQLAADQLPDAGRDDLRALGYLALAPVEHKELKLAKDVIQGLMLDEWDERVDAVSRGLLGLSVACARCHDHKFDPVSTKDYYALAGVFASTSAAARPLRKLDPAVETRFLWLRQRLGDLDFGTRTLRSNQGENSQLAQEKVKAFQAETAALQTELATLTKDYPDLSENVSRLLAPKEEKNAPRRKEDPNAPFVNAVYDAGLWLDGSHPDITMMDFRPGQAQDLPMYVRGNGASPGKEPIPRHFLTVLAKDPASRFQHGSGRIDLAQSIVGDAAALSARVIVNRVWGWHFDKHLVGTPSDFGERGDAPTHPELLDDLTARFIEHGWSLKWLHREIMLSAAYRQSSHARADAEEQDPANRLLWRMNSRRLDIEAYRDSLLEAAGSLNLAMFGPSVEADSADNQRRTVYTKIGRGRPAELLRLYDFPSPFQHSPTRTLTTTPLQQLFVLNSPLMEQLAAALAKTADAAPDGSTRVRTLYRKTLSRDPSPSEVDLALSYLNHATLDRFAQVLLATNEEIYWP